MKILAPVDSAEEAAILMKAGAEELFCGYIPNDWKNEYQTFYGERTQTQETTELLTVSLNKRNNLEGNVSFEDELKKIVSLAKKENVKIFVTLNAFYYTQCMYAYLKKYIARLVEIGVYGFIVTDVGLIGFIKENFPDVYIVLSCCNQVANRSSAAFFSKIGVNRITFPRHVTLEEITEICSSLPNVKFECFILDARCIYDDGNCRAIHNLGHFCMDQWEYETFHSCKYLKDISYDEIQAVRENEKKFTEWTKPYLSQDGKYNGWFPISCSACAVPILKACTNMISLKIAGRGLNTISKIMMVRAAKKMINISEELPRNEAILKEREYISNLVGIPQMCENQSRCLMPSRYDSNLL